MARFSARGVFGARVRKPEFDIADDRGGGGCEGGADGGGGDDGGRGRTTLIGDTGELGGDSRPKLGGDVGSATIVSMIERQHQNALTSNWS